MSGGPPVPLDLELDGIEGAVSAWLLPDGELALVDPGPSTTLATLRSRLGDRGVAIGDLRHLLLTHVHLDHAGAAGHLARENPRLRVHVHPDGAPHLSDPDRLVASTRRTFGDSHDRLWGEVLPVPVDRIRPVEASASGRRLAGPGGGVRPLATPGHIGHHVSWLHEPSETLLAGDALGILLHPDAPVHPPTPPPGIDVAAWLRTLERLAGLGIQRFGAAHFGLHGNLPLRAAELADRLGGLRARVAASLEEEAPADPAGPGPAERYEGEVRRAQADFLPREWVDRYFDTFPAATDWEGMAHHVRR